MKKLWILFAFVLVLALALSACGGTGGTAVEEPAVEEPASEPVEDEVAPVEEPSPAVEEPAGEVAQLNLMGWSSSDAENSRLQEVIDGFNAANGDIEVQLNLVPDFDTKLQTSLAGGAPPDVFYVDSFRLPDLVAANALEPIGGELSNPGDFYPNLQDAFTMDGEFYCPPKDFNTLALQYNKDLFDAAGLDYPTAEWTWSDLRDAAETLTDTDNGTYGMALSADLARWLAFLYQAGGTMTNEDFTAMTLDTPQAEEAMEFYVGMVRDGYAAQPADLDSGWPGEAFGKQNAAMVIEGGWIVPYLSDQFPDLNYGIAELPSGPSGKATLSFTVCYAVPANAPNREASIALVDYLTGPEGMKAWTDLGLAMPTRASLREGWLAQFPDWEPFLNGAEYAQPWQFTPGFADVMDVLNSGMQEAFLGTRDAADVLQEAQEVGQEVLGR